MKHVVLYILLFVSLVFIFNTTGRVYVPVQKPVCAEISSETEGRANQVISVCVAANSYADVSPSQSGTSGFSLVRRYRPAGLPVDNLFSQMAEEKNFALVSSYKNTLLTSREYFARQKLAGYYIYALCKIVI